MNFFYFSVRGSSFPECRLRIIQLDDCKNNGQSSLYISRSAERNLNLKKLKKNPIQDYVNTHVRQGIRSRLTITGMFHSVAHCLRCLDAILSSSVTITPTEIFSLSSRWTNRLTVFSTCPPPCCEIQKIFLGNHKFKLQR